MSAHYCISNPCTICHPGMTRYHIIGDHVEVHGQYVHIVFLADREGPVPEVYVDGVKYEPQP